MYYRFTNSVLSILLFAILGCGGKSYENVRTHGVALSDDTINFVHVHVRGRQWEELGPCPKTRYSPDNYVTISVQYDIANVNNGDTLEPTLSVLENAPSCTAEPQYGYIEQIMPAGSVSQLPMVGGREIAESLTSEERGIAEALGFDVGSIVSRSDTEGGSLLFAIPDSTRGAQKFAEILDLSSEKKYTSAAAGTYQCIWDAKHSRVFWFSGNSGTSFSQHATHLTIWYYLTDDALTFTLKPASDTELQQFVLRSRA